MVPGLVDVGLFGAYLLLLGLIAVQYARGAIASQRVPLLVGMCFTWLAYSLLQLTEDGLIVDPLLAAVLTGLAVVLFVVGLSGLYWWWQHRDRETTDEVTVQ